MFLILATLVHGGALAQLFSVEPSLEVAEIYDDNLFYSSENPAGDSILRIRPALTMRFKSPRWSATGDYRFDAERFAAHESLDSAQAGERARVDVRYRARPRLTLALSGTYIETNNAAELNIDTGLAASRFRAQRMAFGPSARFQISPRLSARVSYLSVTNTFSDARLLLRTNSQTVGLDRKVTDRDLFSLDYEQVFYAFAHARGTSRTDTFVLRGRWIRELGPATSLMLQAGPRFTEGSPTADLSASFSHSWKNSSMTISGAQTETTVTGFNDTVMARNLQASFAYTPTRSLTAYAAPAVFRASRNDLEATVYRIGVGARYAVTPLIGIEASYALDSQHGVISALRPNDEIMRSILIIALTGRWSKQPGTLPGPWR